MHNAAMPNLASTLKVEIARVARKEVRAETESLKRASAQHRSAIAHLKRELEHLQKDLRQARALAIGSQAAGPVAVDGHHQKQRRFSAARLAAHRTKLGLSAADYGKLVGMSGATIYNWEQGKSRPDERHLARVVAVRSMSQSTIDALIRQ